MIKEYAVVSMCQVGWYILHKADSTRDSCVHQGGYVQILGFHHANLQSCS